VSICLVEFIGKIYPATMSPNAGMPKVSKENLSSNEYIKMIVLERSNS